MENVFKAAVVVFVAAAAAFYYFGNMDGVFVCVVLACLSFFLSVRVQVKGRLAEREREAELLTESESSDDYEEVRYEETEEQKKEI